MNLQPVQSIVNKHKNDNGSLIAILSDIQATYSYLPQDALEAVAELTGKSLVDIYGVATFYRYFSLKPRGKHLCTVCVGTACHVRGAQNTSEELERQLGVEAGETTKDREFTLEKVNCLGACALGPVVVIDGHYFGSVKKGQVKGVLDGARNGLDRVEVNTDKRVFPVDVSCSRCNHSLMDAEHLVDGHPSIRVTTSFEHKHVLPSLPRRAGEFGELRRLQCAHGADDRPPGRCAADLLTPRLQGSPARPRMISG